MKSNVLNTYLVHCARFSKFSFVPKHKPCDTESLHLLQDFVNNSHRLFIITGAGVSTESGLPDYRSKDVGLYDRNSHRPVQFKDYMQSQEVRRRYWARNYVGWPRFSNISPNITHYSLVKWTKHGIVQCLVTQNVDRLHHKAGSSKVIELHGTSYIVKCMNCQNIISRNLFQVMLSDLNPNFKAEVAEIRPDADVELDTSIVNSFRFPDCEKCNGILKPGVVFFGENVNKEKVFDLYKKVEDSDALLVLGSSLEVFSGYRFALAASQQNKPVGIVNIGPTRADPFATFHLSVRCGDIIPKVQLYDKKQNS